MIPADISVLIIAATLVIVGFVLFGVSLFGRQAARLAAVEQRYRYLESVAAEQARRMAAMSAHLQAQNTPSMVDPGPAKEQPSLAQMKRYLKLTHPNIELEKVPPTSVQNDKPTLTSTSSAGHVTPFMVPAMSVRNDK